MDQPKKRRNTKSHYGCISCKQRKVKCDESKPACLRCQRLKVPCIYRTDWKSRPSVVSPDVGVVSPASAVASPESALTSPRPLSSVEDRLHSIIKVLGQQPTAPDMDPDSATANQAQGPDSVLGPGLSSMPALAISQDSRKKLPTDMSKDSILSMSPTVKAPTMTPSTSSDTGLDSSEPPRSPSDEEADYTQALQHPERHDVPLEVLLMHHWDTVTCYTLDSPEMQGLFSVHTSKKAMRHRFLLHSLFLISATHLAHRTGSGYYDQAIMTYHSLVLAGLREQLALGITRNNGEAVALCSAILATHSFTCDPITVFTNHFHGWFPLFIGLRDIFHTIKSWRSQGIFAFLDNGLNDPPSPDQQLLTRLQRVLERSGPQSYELYIGPIHSLAELAAFVDQDPTRHCLLQIATWLARAPEGFISAVNAMDPAALVLMANFLQTLLRLRNMWFLGPHVENHLTMLRTRIPTDWLTYLDIY